MNNYVDGCTVSRQCPSGKVVTATLRATGAGRFNFTDSNGGEYLNISPEGLARDGWQVTP